MLIKLNLEFLVFVSMESKYCLTRVSSLPWSHFADKRPCLTWSTGSLPRSLPHLLKLECYFSVVICR